MFRLGQRWYVGLTPRGYEHPQYVLDAPKAQPANLLKDFGEINTCFLQTLFVLGEARTMDITDTLPREFFDGQKYKSGQVTQRLQ